MRVPLRVTLTEAGRACKAATCGLRERSMLAAAEEALFEVRHREPSTIRVAKVLEGGVIVPVTTEYCPVELPTLEAFPVVQEEEVAHAMAAAMESLYPSGCEAVLTSDGEAWLIRRKVTEVEDERVEQARDLGFLTILTAFVAGMEFVRGRAGQRIDTYEALANAVKDAERN